MSGLGLLYQACMLFVGLVFIIILQPYLSSAPFVFTDLAAVLVMSLICFIPFALFGRGVASTRGSTIV